ncbi:hypothetical protein AGOR_G00092740 [Albula goreensis]|uniref:Uncharacterized protein n=1 Tax=Albula goreensis TaxID=1534307 RepID=A0A8T3DLL9_9TELE|nr:hypothetical protein AGOR_G00092740 [Albula goreensis]
MLTSLLPHPKGQERLLPQGIGFRQSAESFEGVEEFVCAAGSVLTRQWLSPRGPSLPGVSSSRRERKLSLWSVEPTNGCSYRTYTRLQGPSSPRLYTDLPSGRSDRHFVRIR